MYRNKETKIMTMTTSVKHEMFVREPMGDKDVCELAGIGPRCAELFRNLGFDKAYNLLGQFLILNQDEEMFCAWLAQEISDGHAMSKKHRTDVYHCLKQWCQNNL